MDFTSFSGGRRLLSSTPTACNRTAGSQKGNTLRCTRGEWLTVMACAALAWSARAQAPARPEPLDSKPAQARSEMGPPAPAPRSLDDLGIPPNAVIVICDDPQKAVNLVPRGVVLTPQRYQELLRLERESTQRAAAAVRLAVPTSCKLSGRVEGDIARVQVQYQFVTDKLRTLVTLGCQRAWPRSATLDAHLPLFVTDSSRDEGLVVQVDTPGTHNLTLDLAVPLTNRGPKGAERGFDLGLPRCAITNLDTFEVPGDVAEIKVNARPVQARANAGGSRIENEALGAADRLEVSWKGRGPAATKVAPLYIAEGRVVVRVEERRAVTDVELQLQVLAGEVQEYRIRLPARVRCDLREPAASDERLERRELPRDDDPWLTLRFKKPTSEPFRVAFQAQQSWTGSTVPVGPFAVAGALRQTGTIAVAAAPEFRLAFQTNGDILRHELTEDASRGNTVAGFTYWNVPATASPAEAPPPQLRLDVQTVRGAVESRVDHTLELTPAGWQVATRLDLTPLRTGVDVVEVEVPENYPFDAVKGVAPAEMADPPLFDATRRTATIRLAQKQFRPFSLTLPALYPVAPGGQQTLELPRPLNTLDRGAQASVIVPGDMELVRHDGGFEQAAAGSGSIHRYTQSWPRAPRRVELARRAYRPELRVVSVSDVTFRVSQAVVRQRLEFDFRDRVTDRVALEIPQAIGQRAHVVQGGSLNDQGQFILDRAATRAIVVLAYELPATPRESNRTTGSSFSLPLIRVPAATRTEWKARLWCDATQQLGLVEGPWEEAPPEVAPEKDNLPTLVLKSIAPDPPLLIRREDNPGMLSWPFIVDRSLIQVLTAEDGPIHYRARYVLNRIANRHLDVRLPAPLGNSNLAVWLDGKQVTTIRSVDDHGNPVENGSVVRILVEPELYRGPVLLDLRYQMPARRRDSGTVLTTFQPPVFLHDVRLGPVRWQINLPNDAVVVCRESDPNADISWSWRGALLTPMPVSQAADVERWLSGARRAETDTLSPAPLACWRSDLEPVTVLQVPRAAWLFSCSATLLAVALTLLFMPPLRPTWLAVLGGLILAGGWLTIAWPHLLPVVLYGCEPALAVLAVTGLVQAVRSLSDRQRRRYLPAFTRSRSSGGVAQAGSSHRQRREPTTVDAPPARGSSVLRQPQPQEP